MFSRRHDGPQNGASERPSNPFVGLRLQALSTSAELAGFTQPPPGRTVYGGIMDWALERGLATVFTLENGTGSLYLSSGGGIIGGQFHEPVRRAVHAFVAAFEPFVSSMTPDADGAVPPGGYTDLRALTVEGRLVVRAPTDDLGNGRHPMWRVFHAGQAVITALRQAPPARAMRA